MVMDVTGTYCMRDSILLQIDVCEISDDDLDT